MQCQELHTVVPRHLAGELTREEQGAFEAHLAQCAKCAEEAQSLAAAWQALEAWPEQPVPQAAITRILSTAREAVGGLEPARAITWAPLRSLARPLGAFVMGLVAAVLTGLILSSRLDLADLHPLSLTFVGSLWTGVYGVIFYILLSAGKTEASSWREFAQASMTAVTLFLLFTLVSPVPTSIHFCSHYSVTQPIIERLSVGGSFFLFGALYALVPMGVAAYFSASRSRHPFARGSLAGGMFVVLLAPSIYLQCAPFALGVLLVWFGGALLGSVLGGVLGFWVRYRVANG